MKKFVAIMLALALALCLAACGGEENPNEDLVITRGPETPAEPAQNQVSGENQDVPETPGAASVFTGPYVFESEGVKLVPGEAYDGASLPEALSTMEVPSCAVDGTNIMYTHELFELTTYDEGNGEVVYSILFTSPDLATAEGLALGDSVEKMEELYGTGYELTGENYVYTNGVTQFSIIAQEGVVRSIEYRMAM